MEERPYDYHQLSREDFRRDTYGDILNDIKNDLVKAGFYFTKIGQKVKCFSCLFEFDVSEVSRPVDFVNYHKEKSPECAFIKSLKLGTNAPAAPLKKLIPECTFIKSLKLGANASAAPPKKLLSCDSLLYEKERLKSFIEWPVPWLLPEELAADGFYYLRVQDQCRCYFCRGTLGKWIEGDTPRGEHKRHFPKCPFIRGLPVGNVTMDHSRILDKLSLHWEESSTLPPNPDTDPDTFAASCSGISRKIKLSGSNAEYCPVKKNMNLDETDLKSSRRDYITKESRVESFKQRPAILIKNPEEMAEAGFFYCGLNDQVYCFHCGNGLRNWMHEDKPWEEHASWYPDCKHVLLTRGQEFIEKVRHEKSPYLLTSPSKDNTSQTMIASSGRFKSISDSDLEVLMDSDIIKGVKDMGFSHNKICMALRQKLELTGKPFFSLESCIEAVLKITEDETQDELQGSSATTQTEEEARNLQDEQTQSFHAGSFLIELPGSRVIPHSPVTTEAPQHNSPVNTTSTSQLSSCGMSLDSSGNSLDTSTLQLKPNPEIMKLEEESTEILETQKFQNNTTGENLSERVTVSPDIITDSQEALRNINKTEESEGNCSSFSLDMKSKNEENL